MTEAAVRVERTARLFAPAERVWEWMCDARTLTLFHLNVFHAHAECDEAELAPGVRVRIDHKLGWKRERRVARISKLEPFEIAWAEVKEEGEDWFPHFQRFTLTPDGPECRLRNALRGTFRLPGARWWLVPWYRHVLPRVLDHENRAIAAATGGRPAIFDRLS